MKIYNFKKDFNKIIITILMKFDIFFFSLITIKADIMFLTD